MSYRRKIVQFLIASLFLVYNSAFASVEAYLLGPGDRILITVYDEPDLRTEVKIDKSGLVSFPFLSDIQVVGLRTADVEKIITDGLRGDYLVNPQVSVSIVVYRPFFIHGEVKKPGSYPYQDDLTLDKAIALAGGLSPRASKSKWNITRVVDGKTVVVKANITSYVMPDDIIEIEQSFF
ncbi:polysaccharide biosynthesis/export family protein [Thalassotalea euphylliae]|uniref:polysaccharide biosynthesis/export family protein n=1 Tax=Thalassotalea euphylliae TaxID=1655234 RepID=UPI00363D432F